MAYKSIYYHAGSIAASQHPSKVLFMPLQTPVTGSQPRVSDRPTMAKPAKLKHAYVSGSLSDNARRSAVSAVVAVTYFPRLVDSKMSSNNPPILVHGNAKG